MREYSAGNRFGNNKMYTETDRESELFGSVSVKRVFENRQSFGNFGKLSIDRKLENYFWATQTNRTFISLLPYLELVRLSSEERIYEAGDNIDFVYFPETAIISEFLILESGGSSEIAMTGKEGVVGLLALGASHSASNLIRVLVPGSAYRIKPEILKRRMAVDPALRNAIVRYLTNYIDQLSAGAVCKRFHSVEERLCTWLLMVQDRRSMTKLSLTHEQIGFSLGVQRSCVANAAHELKNKKIIAYVRGKITILNREELMRSACDCYSEITGLCGVL